VDNEQALTVFAEHKIDLLLSDIILPSMDGCQLAAQVKQRYLQVKIQLASGFSDVRNPDLVDDELRADQLEKPYRLAELLRRVRQLLDA